MTLSSFASLLSIDFTNFTIFASPLNNKEDFWARILSGNIAPSRRAEHENMRTQMTFDEKQKTRRRHRRRKFKHFMKPRRRAVLLFF